MSERIFPWKERCVVITGASSGAGRAIATELARRGAMLVMAARRQDALAEVQKECLDLGAEVITVITDVKKAEDQRQLSSYAFEWKGRIDAWINNAGVLAAGSFDEIPEEVNEDVIRTNLLGYIHGAHAVLPYFKQQGYGIIINNISVGGWFPTPYMSAYSASKFGLRGFSESLKGELNQFPDIHICDLYPGFLDTPGIQHAANYTGKVLRPAPPVYDPRRVANAIVELIQEPRSKVTIGAASGFLKFAYALFPSLSRNVTSGVIRKYLHAAVPIETTSGNILQPVDYGTGIDGGWQQVINRPVKRSALLVLAGAVIGLALLTRR